MDWWLFMSRVKYRVWDKEEKKYCDSFAIHLDGDYLGYSTTFGGYSRIPEDMKDRFVVELFIGLKDRNGIEIFEGDIVRHASNHDLKGIVTYVGKEYIFKRIHRPKDGGVFIPFRPKNLIEVIGNVHQNPELLEKK